MSGENSQSGNSSHRVAAPHASSKCEASRQKQIEDSSTIPFFYENVSDDPGGKNLTFLCKLCPPGFKKQLRTSTTSTANLRRHIELKHPASLSRYVRVTKKSKDMATASQNRCSTIAVLNGLLEGFTILSCNLFVEPAWYIFPVLLSLGSFLVWTEMEFDLKCFQVWRNLCTLRTTVLFLF